MTTTTSASAPSFRALASGAIVEIDARGRAQFVTCDWLVEVPSGHPEPDSLADCFVLVGCGARVRVHPAYLNDPRVEDVMDATICENGHDRVSYASGLSADSDWEREEEYRLNVARFGPAWELEQTSPILREVA